MTMRANWLRNACLLAALGAMATAGCGGSQEQGGKGQAAPAQGTGGPGADAHAGWWCVEHGVPEAECSMCSATAADKFKAKGDWCKEHNRAESQCFLCDPSRAEKFVALHEAKFGKKPPKAGD